MRNNMHPTTAPLYRPSRNNRRVRPREEYGMSDIRKTTRKMENANNNNNNNNKSNKSKSKSKKSNNINNENEIINNSSHSHNRGHVEIDYEYQQHASQRIHRSLSASVSSSSLSRSSSSRSPDRAGASTNHLPKRHPHPTRQNSRYSNAQSPPTHRTEPSSAPSSSSSSKKKKHRNVMIYLKHLILRCFLARRQRKLRRMVAAKRMQRQRCNSFGSEDENEYSTDQTRSTVPSNETEMYVMLRAKRTDGSSIGHHNLHHHNHPSSSRHPSRTVRTTNHGCESNRHHRNHHHYHHHHHHHHHHHRKHPPTPVTNRQSRTYSDDGHTRQSFSALSLAPRTRALTTGSVSPHQVFLDELRSEDRDSIRSLL